MLLLGDETVVLRWTKNTKNTLFWSGLFFYIWHLDVEKKRQAHEDSTALPHVDASIHACVKRRQRQLGATPEEGVGVPAKSSVFQAERVPENFSVCEVTFEILLTLKMHLRSVFFRKVTNILSPIPYIFELHPLGPTFLS